MEQVVFLLVVGAIALIRWLYEKSQGVQDERRDSDEPKVPHFPRPRRPPADTEQERMRRFMEALGIPVEPAERPPIPSPKPPPLVKQAPPPIPVAAQPLPEPEPEREAFGVQTIEGSMEEIRRVARQAEEEANQILARAGVSAHAAKAPVPRISAPQLGALNLPALLGDPMAVRSAIVLREVLGPPKALEPVGDIPGLR